MGIKGSVAQAHVWLAVLLAKRLVKLIIAGVHFLDIVCLPLDTYKLVKHLTVYLLYVCMSEGNFMIAL